MRAKLILLASITLILLSFAMPAGAQADGILVYTGEQESVGGVGVVEFADFGKAAGYPYSVSYLDVPMTAGYDLSGYDCVILAGVFRSGVGAFQDTTKALLKSYVMSGGRLLALAEWEEYAETILAMSDLASYLGSDLRVYRALLDNGHHVTDNIDSSPFTVGVDEVALAASAQVSIPWRETPRAHSMVRSTNGSSVLGAEQLGLGWFFLSGDSNIFTDEQRLKGVSDIYSLYDNDVLAWNIVNALRPAPPLLTLPADMTVPATSPDGAEVTFVVTATDDDGIASLEVLPASGSHFPIGTTTVTVTATDGSGETAMGSFTVTVTALNAFQLKQDALARLNTLYPTINDPSKRSWVEKAARRIEKSLAAAYWVDDMHLVRPTGVLVFDAEREAASFLSTAIAHHGLDAEAVAVVFGELLQADRLLAVQAMQDANGVGSAHLLSRAQSFFAQGDSLGAEDKVKQAISAYRIAWLLTVSSY